MLSSVTDIPSRKVLGLNQQTYQQLKLALSLHLRRQIFIAVCDDLILRDRMANQLQRELEQSPSTVTGAQRYPRLVSLQLNLNDPNPVDQITRWLAQFPPLSSGASVILPAFQLLGVEHLTRQPAAQQRRFLTHLQAIERSLPKLESSLLMWLPQPWFRSLSQSAPAFWRCRTGVFEFVGDPTPLPAATKRIGKPFPSPPPSRPAQPVPPRSADPPPPLKADVWGILTQDLAKFDRGDVTEPDDSPALSDLLPIDTDADALAQTLGSLLSGQPKAAPAASVLATETPLSAQPAAPTLTLPAAATQDRQTLPLLLKIEQLQQQQAPAAALADAYRSLGNLYRDRIEQGDASQQNLAIAIQAYEQVLVGLPEASLLWADVLNDLGNLYWMLSRQMPSVEQAVSRLQQSVQAYQLALSRTDRQSQQSQAMIQNNLGAAFADLARYQDPVENLQRSLQAYQQALVDRQPNQDPLRYASTQNNLGATYWNLAQHQQPVSNLKQAIGAYSEALRYYTAEQEPLNYAMLQNNLGTAYWNLAQHERPQEWLRLALSAYRNALRFRTLAAAPAAFAATQSNLGTACWHLANHSEATEAKQDYLQQAVVAYDAALMAAAQVLENPQAAPLSFDRFATHNNLGLAHYQLASDRTFNLTADERSAQLESALQHHLAALQGWQHKPELRQTALNCIVQAVRACYSHSGLTGQNTALSQIPGHLLPEILPQL